MPPRRPLYLATSGIAAVLASPDYLDPSIKGPSSVITPATAASATGTASAVVLTVPITANALQVGSLFSFELWGGATTVAQGQSLTVALAVGATTIASLVGNYPLVVASSGFMVKGLFVVGAIGANGSIAASALGTFFDATQEDGGITVPAASSAINTTIAQTLSISLSWGAAGNTATAQLGFLKQEL